MIIVAIWSFAEATLFFLVADVPISAVGLRHGTRRALRAALVAALASGTGGVTLSMLAAASPEAMHGILDLIPGIGPRMIDEAAAAFAEDGVGAMLAGSFSGVPYKLFAHAAGLEQSPPIVFLVLSVAARLPRFLLVAVIFGSIRPVLSSRLSRRRIATIFIVFWVLFYAAYFSAVGL
jgi:membrane protein YqaA with SNARE-associated domain